MKRGVFTMMFFFSLVTVGSVVTLSGCDLFNHCGTTIATHKIDNIAARLLLVLDITRTENGFTHKNTEEFPDGLASSTFDSIGISIAYDYIIANLQEKVFLPFAMNKLYACTPHVDVFPDRINAINITSDVDYDNAHQAGTSLNDIVVITGRFGSLNMSVDEIIEFYSDVYESPILLIMMSIAPEIEGMHIFTIDITLEDGRVLSQQLDPVTIKI